MMYPACDKKNWEVFYFVFHVKIIIIVYRRITKEVSLQMYASYFQQNLPPGGGTVSDSDILDEWNSGRHSPKVSICGSDDDPPSGSTTPKRKLSKFTICEFLISFDSYLAFSLFGVGASNFHSPRSPVLCFFHLYFFSHSRIFV